MANTCEQMKKSDGAHLSSSFPSEIMFDLEASASVFKARLIFYTLKIYLHIDLKTGFIVHAIINQTKNYQAPVGCTDLFETVSWC